MILVTGGAGFIGSHVVDMLIDAGYEVAVVDDLSTGSRENLNTDAKFYELDIRSTELANVFEREEPTHVYHLAAQMDVRKSIQEPLFDADVNIAGSINLLENCVKHKVKKIIYASTAGAVYGEPSELPVPETYPPNPICHYGASKLAVEYYLRLYHHLYGLTYTILRFANVYGPRQNPHGEAGVCSILTLLMLDGKSPTLYGFGKPLRDYVYVKDVARANLLALDKGDQEFVNICSGKGTSVQQLFDSLKEILDVDIDPVLEPLRVGEVHDIYTACNKAEEVLGWKPIVDIHEGLTYTADFIRNKNAN